VTTRATTSSAVSIYSLSAVCRSFQGTGGLALKPFDRTSPTRKLPFTQLTEAVALFLRGAHDYAGPMDPHLIEALKREVRNQCEFAMMAFDDLEMAVKESSEAGHVFFSSEADVKQKAEADARHDGATRRIWYSINQVLNASASVSKLLWPSEARRKRIATAFPERGEILREALGVAEDSPLQHRNVRDSYEHVDERYEEWWLDSKHHNIALHVIGPLGQVVGGFEENELFEQFDPDAYQVAFQGNVYALRPIAKELSELLSRLRA
jgi:hypothetical protein